MIENVDFIPYTMIKTIVTEYQIDGEIWEKKDGATTEKKAGRIPNIKQWIEKNYKQGSTINLDKYYEEFPKDDHDKIQKYISDMIAERKIQQLHNNQFKKLY